MTASVDKRRLSDLNNISSFLSLAPELSLCAGAAHTIAIDLPLLVALDSTRWAATAYKNSYKQPSFVQILEH
jgi:hypothetical protein